jgi:hypothetical protein
MVGGLLSSTTKLLAHYDKTRHSLKKIKIILCDVNRLVNVMVLEHSVSIVFNSISLLLLGDVECFPSGKGSAFGG